MLAISPYTKITVQIDTLKGLTDSTMKMQQVQSAKMDSVCDATARLVDGQSALYGGVDSIHAQILTITEKGMGYSDALGYIALPLIIALFAFAFTYLFSVITRINEKYNSEHISGMFKTSKAYRCYMWGSGISVGYIILMGLLSLALSGIAHQVFMKVMNWTCFVVAGAYAGIILWFVRTCLEFDDNQNMLGLIVARYQQEKAKSSSLNVRTQRLIDLCKYSLQIRNKDLFIKVLDRVNKLDKEERDVKGKSVEFYTMQFYESVADSLIQNPQDWKTEDDVLRNWQLSFRHDKLPFSAVICRMLGKMVEAVKQGRYSLFEIYADRCRYGFGFINRVPLVGYASGMTVDELIKLGNEQLETWRELREVHFLAAAYLFSIGHYEVAAAMKKGIGYDRDAFYPDTPAEILKQYVRIKDKQNADSGAYHPAYWSIDNVIGHKYDRDILEKFTAMMLLLAVDPDEEEEYLLNEKQRNIILSNKDELIRFGNLWKQHAELLSRYPMIGNKDVEDQIEMGLEHLSMGEPKEEDNAKKTKRTKPNFFDLKIKTKDEEPIKNLFGTILFSNRGSLTDGLNGDLTEDKREEIKMGAYTFLTSKQIVLTPVIWQDHNVFYDLQQVFRSRYIYMMYEAISQMKIKDVEVKWGDFEQVFLKHVGENGDGYVIIDTDCNLDAMIRMDKLPEGVMWSPHRYYKKAYHYDAGLGSSFHLRDLPLGCLFDDTVIIMRMADLPVLVPTSEIELPEVSIVDESSREKGWAPVRITVDPCLVARYSKTAKVVRVRFK